MGVDITTSWIIHIWIRQLIVCVCAQVVFSKPSCGPHQYVRDKRCCKKCEPGKYMLYLCTSTVDTICRSCGPNEYQPDWNNETKCLTQKFCDRGRGFEPDRPENHTAAVPCRCRPGLQCSLVNCEYCEKMPACPPGYGITVAETGRGSCVECRPGLFSNVSSAIEPCRPWTDCKALGRAEKEPGTAKTDANCGPRVSASTVSWAIVAVLSVITAISLVVLFLFCCKDKLKAVTENVRTCMQDLKRNSMLQETALNSYDVVHGTQNCTLEITCLIRQEGDPKASHCASAGDRGDTPEHAAAVQTTGGAGEPSAGACRESWEPDPATPPPPSGSSSGSCSCVLSLKEPLEVGENEDCSQAVAPSCACSYRTAECPLLEEQPVCGRNCSGEALYDPCPGSCHGRVERRGASEGGAGSERDCGAEEEGCRSTDSTAKAALSLVGDCEPGLPLHLSTSDLTQGPELKDTSHTVAAGHVTGNNNTTFISNGQVMNFSGDVIVVYVSQDSQADGGDLEEAFPNPVQEETNKEGFEVVTKPKTSQLPQENVSVF